VHAEEFYEIEHLLGAHEESHKLHTLFILGSFLIYTKIIEFEFMKNNILYTFISRTRNFASINICT